LITIDHSEEELYETPLDDAQCVEGGVDRKISNGRLMALASTEPHAVWLMLMISHLGLTLFMELKVLKNNEKYHE